VWTGFIIENATIRSFHMLCINQFCPNSVKIFHAFSNTTYNPLNNMCVDLRYTVKYVRDVPGKRQ